MNRLSIDLSKKVFESFLKEAGYKADTIKTKMIFVQVFFHFLLQENRNMDLRDVDKNVITDYVKYINAVISLRTGKPYSKRSKIMLLSGVRLLFRGLLQSDLILSNPAQDIFFRPQGEIKRRGILTENEMNFFLDSLDNIRDRAMFELMYSSGLRVSEVVNLKISDIQFDQRMILIRQAKWDKDRVVPVNEVAIVFIKKFLELRLENKEDFVFSSGKKKGIHKSMVNRRFKKLLADKNMDNNLLSAHSFRHSVATHLLAHGADLRYVQELLGHNSIETTVGYTNEMQENMKRIYRRFHPRENDSFKEIDPQYLAQINDLSDRLTNRHRLQHRRWCRTRQLSNEEKFVLI